MRRHQASALAPVNDTKVELRSGRVEAPTVTAMVVNALVVVLSTPTLSALNGENTTAS